MEHDLALMLTGYVIVNVSMRAKHGEAAQEAQRLTRANMKTALLSVLRKHYHKAAADELKLGANMVNYVDEMLTAAEAANTAMLEQVLKGNLKFEGLTARLATTFGTDAAKFEKFLGDQYTKVSAAIAVVPND